jgi:ABC-type glycerol-3-phosphate transport system permease component
VNLGVELIPRGFTLFLYSKVLALKGIGNALFISIARTVLGTLATVFCCSLLGYLFTKQEMPARKFLYRMLIITMYVSGGLIPYFLLIRSYGLVNNFLVYIIPGMVSAFNVVLVKTFIEQLPASLEESAMLDGASYFTIFTRIIFPLSMPIVATIAVFSAVGQWNSWFDNYLFAGNNIKLRTLQLMLYNILTEAQRLADLMNDPSGGTIDPKRMTLTPAGVRMTITMLVTLPILIVYPFMQRFFIKGIMLGAVKG